MLIDDRLAEIARQEGISKADTMRKAFALLSIAEEEKERGNSLVIAREAANNIKDNRGITVVGRVTGI